MSKDIERMNRLISDIAYYTKIKAEIETEDFEYIKILKLLKVFEVILFNALIL